MIQRYRRALFQVDLDPVVGSEQSGRRPVLVVGNEAFNQAMPVLTVLPLSSTRRRLYPAEVMLKRAVAGQSVDSIIMAHQVRTISKHRIGEAVGYLSEPSIREQVRRALRDHLDLG
ncbi:MAG TPA: type II toxin-antitoxin system PemK/MazF family toxin [bacterium]|nr:type II toxin-antitoxin system PemK/MazF family toxin [bacterium]